MIKLGENNKKKPSSKKRRSYNSPKRDWAMSDVGIDTISGWAIKGATKYEIAEMIGVSPKTFNDWRNKCRDLRNAVDVSASMANARVLNSAFKAAIGYDYKEEELDRFGEIHELLKHQAANSTILKFWLMNRMGEDWRDKQSIDVSGEVDHRLKDIPTDELIGHFKALESEDKGDDKNVKK